ncbi:hypothetical protein LBYS11_16435 [Lysinibacillus sp. YS11]|uniref:hypothetical protein n=1 Tax=Lysinibacillus sp. YS11 TaxID=2072025 RepID=UPI000CA32C93|nr:hypothetical protein [Lysinibacillus sp. YS11]AUS87826.1 hypothetical protein LBYS11_16435 [Lysinibacillus sp. YS11]
MKKKPLPEARELSGIELAMIAINLEKQKEEIERLRKALEKVMEVEAPIMEGWETPAYKIAREALGGEAHE